MPEYTVTFKREEVGQVIEDLQKMNIEKTMVELRADAAKENKEKIDELMRQIEELNHPKPKKHGGLNGKWSRKYDECIKCHRSDSPHSGKGVCARCRSKEEWRKRYKVPVALDVRSDHVITKPKKQL